MKKHVTLVLCSLVFAQWSASMEYQRMITKENKWNYVQEHYPSCIGCGGETKTHAYFVSNDTVIGAKTYQKIMRAEIRYNGIDTTFFCAAREDSMLQHVYWKPDNRDEQVLYRFDVDSGALLASDTSFLGGKPNQIMEQKVTSVGRYDFNGFTGKRISVATILKHANVDFDPMALMTEDWYEGLGHLTYFLGMGDELELLCFWNDGQQRYLNPTYNACVVTAYLPNALEQTTQASDFRFLPNPANEELRIESEIAFERAELYTLSGTKLLETRERTVNLRALGAGVYLLKIHLESGAIVTGKVLKW